MQSKMVSIKKLNYFDIETIFFNYISYIFQLKRKWYVVHTQLLSVRYRVKPLHFFLDIFNLMKLQIERHTYSYMFAFKL